MTEDTNVQHMVQLGLLDLDPSSAIQFFERSLANIKAEPIDLIVFTDLSYTMFCHKEVTLAQERFSELGFRECLPAVIWHLNRKYPKKTIKVIALGESKENGLYSQIDYLDENRWIRLPQMQDVEVLYTQMLGKETIRSKVAPILVEFADSWLNQSAFLFLSDSTRNKESGNQIAIHDLYGYTATNIKSAHREIMSRLLI